MQDQHWAYAEHMGSCSLHHVITHGLGSSCGLACLDKAHNQGKVQVDVSCDQKLDHNVCELTQGTKRCFSRFILCVCRNWEL